MSKKNVNLRIKNTQYTESLELKGEAFSRELEFEDDIEILTEGTLYQKGDSTYIQYQETEETGMESIMTVIKMANGKLSIKRYGEDEAGAMDLTLEQGVMSLTRFHAPMVNFNLEIYTNKVEDGLGEDGYGIINADYSIRMEDIMSRRNKLEIEVQPS